MKSGMDLLFTFEDVIVLFAVIIIVGYVAIHFLLFNNSVQEHMKSVNLGVRDYYELECHKPILSWSFKNDTIYIWCLKDG